MESQQKKKTGKGSPSGKVWLAGAGPGDASLLTLKVKKWMDEADVIIYDALISAEILSLIPDGKEWIYVGKRSGHHCVRQEEINQILLREAKAGKNVLRLKGGDPFVFGRGAEEAECLAAEGIPFEIIPGVTSALAVPAYAGIPITHRDFASSFHVITGHAKEGKKIEIPYDALAKLNGTLIFLMGITAMEEICRGLIQAGMDENTPAAVLEKGTTARQRRLVSTLARLWEDAKAFQVQTPAIILVGKVCTLSEKFDWVKSLPLWGKQILTTRPRQNSSRLAGRLRELGAQVIELPSITTKPVWPNEVLGTALERIREQESEQWLVFTSPIGVQTFWKQLRMLKMDVRNVFLPHVKVAAIGSGTAKELEQFGVFADVMPQTFCAAALGEAIAGEAAPKSRIVLLRAKQGSGEYQRTGKRAVAGVYQPHRGTDVLETAQNAENGCTQCISSSCKSCSHWFRYSKGTGTVWRVCGCHAADILCSGTGGGDRKRSSTKEPDCTAAGEAGIRRAASAAEKRRIEGGRCASV